MGQRRASSTTFFEAGFTWSSHLRSLVESVDGEGPQPAGPSRPPRDLSRLRVAVRAIRSGAADGDQPGAAHGGRPSTGALTVPALRLHLRRVSCTAHLSPPG